MLPPIDRMLDRVESARHDSDTALFYDLLFLGELITKLTVAGVVAGIADDADRHRYRLLHRLVRTDGIGDWCSVLADATTGPAAVHLAEGLRDDQRVLSANVKADAWQHEAVLLLGEALRAFDGTREGLPQKLSLQRWFALFAELRNKTRGHGATRASACSEACPRLERSIGLVIANLPLFEKPWVYLHRNLSGKYRVTPLGGDPNPFFALKTTTTARVADGVYLFADGMHRVELLHSNVDAIDFYLPNGAFNDRKVELLSYITDNRSTGDSAPYLAPVGALPASETQGLGRLEVLGRIFTNLPPHPDGYVSRPQLEKELQDVLLSERHQMVTLVGRGGVGKTSLALSVLHRIAQGEQYTAVLWFSARDIDLLPTGPKLVSASVLSEQDIAKEFVRLVEPKGASERGFVATSYLAEQLTCSDVGPLLLVFDNFETVRNPRELYNWIDTYIRAPNKALITTRFREFKGDYAVDVPGMTEAECEQLIRQTAEALRIQDLLTDDYIAELYREADGHPYVVKVLLGEVAKERRRLKVERIIATQDEILDALFERTYAGLSPAARRVFLLLCSWRSVIPEIAIEAILLRPANERMDVRGSVEELRRMSLIELRASADGTMFVAVPLAAMMFGRRKLTVSPAKAAVEADAQLLYAFGAARDGELRYGVGPRVERFFKEAAERIAHGEAALDEYHPILEYLARQYTPGWLLLSELLDESGRTEEARSAVASFLERSGDPHGRAEAWQRLADLARRERDAPAEMHALVEFAQQEGLEFDDVSRVASRINGLVKNEPRAVDSDEKRILIKRLIDVLASRVREASATDLSRLAWLCIHVRDVESARRYVEIGLQDEPDNEYLINLDRRLRSEAAYAAGGKGADSI